MTHVYLHTKTDQIKVSNDSDNKTTKLQMIVLMKKMK